ncbi:GntR family transcriptional regulator [Aliihoeflea sp. PC F10.4]
MDTAIRKKGDVEDIYRQAVNGVKIEFSEPMSPQIYMALRQAIIQNRIEPGTPIYESKFADVLGVSRTPFRAALQQLAKEELVETRPQVGSVVTSIDRQKIFSAIFCRGAIEVAVVKRLATIGGAKLDRLSRVLAIQADCTSRDDYIAFFEVDEEFHRLLAEIAGVPDAWRLIVSSKTHVDRARLQLQSSIPGRAAKAYREHLLIVDAIRAGDPELAAELMQSHVNSVMDILRGDHPNP